MPSLEEMSIAHLNNVQKAINDLQAQKTNAEQEIEKLQQYYEEGKKQVESQTQED